MKKTVLIGLLSSLLVAGALIVSLPANAADTTGEIGFEATENPPGTKDPNPDPKPNPDPDPDPKPEPGALRFTHRPDFKFGKDNALITGSQNYYPNFEERTVNDGKETYKYPHTFVVEDVRGGTKGWSVNVLADGKFKDESGKNTFVSDLYFSDAHVKSSIGLDAATKGPIAEGVGTTAVKATTGDKTAVRLATADAKEGRGYSKWAVGYGGVETPTTGKGVDGNGTTGTVDAKKAGRNPGVRLYIPTGQILDTGITYTTTVTWELSNTF